MFAIAPNSAEGQNGKPCQQDQISGNDKVSSQSNPPVIPACFSNRELPEVESLYNYCDKNIPKNPDHLIEVKLYSTCIKELVAKVASELLSPDELAAFLPALEQLNAKALLLFSTTVPNKQFARDNDPSKFIYKSWLLKYILKRFAILKRQRDNTILAPILLAPE
ncbi:MAG: hypothetical protein HQL56_08855 [Magnetococcales bacterium]|nr:hypothetical protein [Magnetococcales bacterium]